MEMPMSSGASGARFPIQNRAVSLDIKVIVTQIGCMGTILAAKKDESVFWDPTYTVSVLFGKRDVPLLLDCARQLIEHIRLREQALY